MGLGLAVACFVLAGMLRGEWAYALGWVMQVVAIGLGFLIPMMFVLGRDLRDAVGDGVLPRPQDRAGAGRGVRRRSADVTEPLSPTERTTLGRLSEKGRADRRELLDLLDTALVAHVGVDAGGYPLVLPTAYAVDADGPDRGRHALLPRLGRGQVAGVPRGEAKVCVTVTEVDGLVRGALRLRAAR